MNIIVDLTGRVGNQLFQYACARYFQELTGGKIILNDYSLRHYSKFKEELSQFKLNENVEFSSKKLPMKANRRSLGNRFFNKMSREFIFRVKELQNVFYWYGRTYKKPKLNLKKDIYLSGYFQTELFFPNMHNILIEEFQPKNLTNVNEQNDFKQSILISNSVCVTIRRGNYVNNENLKKIFFVADEDYFDKAIKKMDSLINSPEYFFFSDDLNWVVSKYHSANYHIEPANLNVSEKIYYMSLCKNFVISNSSFSWWAQYLSLNENKQVIAPSKWYSDSRDTSIYELQNNWVEL